LRHALFGGRMKWMRNISRPTRLEDGTIVWDGIAIDITDRKDAEAALEGAKAELETARRAAETAQREAESASRAKSDFLATMSHEIRTPMNGVLGMASVLQDTPLTEQQRIYVTTIRQSGEALLAIINDILDFSKMEAGRIDLEPVEFDVGEMLDSIFRLLGPAARDKGLDMPAFVAPDVPRKLVGDVGRLRQIVLNLLGNGLKFTESGAVAVEISLAARDERGVTLRCEVTDTGIGIEPEVREALFTRFSQGDSSTTRRFGGTGLGLAICKQLVQLMRGEIRVDSTPGKGSRFWFTVRLGEAGAAGEASPLRGWRILVAESEELCRRVLRRQLEAWGANVAEVADGAEAERVVAAAPERVDAQRSDIVLCDSRLPDIGGLDLARRLRHRAPDGFGRFILMSKIAADDLGSALANFGVDDYLTKPFTPAALRDCLSRLAPDGPAAEPRRKLGSPAARGGPALVAETTDERTAGATSRR
jgi:signal transduction histidine kinase/DNA-binding NarL/FixJ family response regulator